MLPKTESIDELLCFLQRSAVSVVVFSERFADSTWCLDEIVTIVRRMKGDHRHRVLPVFYGVEPSDVTDDSGSYSALIDALLEANPGAGNKEVWMDALKEVANRAGHTSGEKKIKSESSKADGGNVVKELKPSSESFTHEANRILARTGSFVFYKIESELVSAVVDDVSKTLIDMSPSIVYNKLVDMGSRILEVERLLAMDDVTKHTCIIGLWGMGGSGKTTLAEACYQRQTSSPTSTKGPFFKHHFIRNISEKCEAQRGVDGLILELYSQLLSEENLTRENLNNVALRRRLSNLRVLLLLDNVGSMWQLDQLLLGSIFSNDVTKLFAPGSRIIVTARDKKVIQHGQVVTIHPVECLQDGESLQVFSLFAFGESAPPDVWMDLSRKALSYCSGNPLALRVLGGILNGEDRRYWQSFLESLTLGRTGVPEIHDILRKSYDKLNDKQQPLFLDVACFLHGMLRSKLLKFTKTSCYDAYSDVQDLINKSLLVCANGKDGEMIEVHDLLKYMAWQIVNKERDLRKCSRLENPEDITELLQTLKGTDRATEAINLNLSKIKDMNLEANAFQGMNSLKWLKFYWSHVRLGRCKLHIPVGRIDFLTTKLRGLQWDIYPLRSLPSGFSPENLRILALRDSHIVKCWEGEGETQAAKLVNLVELDLYGCRYLTALPDLSKSTHLEVLILRDCRSLVELPSCVGYLDKLVRLDVEDCSNLERIPTKFKSKHLKYVLMSKCFKVTRCPDINSKELEVLDLDRTPISAAPPASIYNKMKQGGILSLHCRKITSFPQLPERLEKFSLSNTSVTEIKLGDQHHSDSALNGPRFGQLWLVNNSKLESLPLNIWKMVSREVVVDCSPLIETLPEILEAEGMEGFTWLAVTRCKLLKHVPSSINNMKFLQVLNFSGTAIETLPDCIQDLSELLTLELSNCSRLESIPDILHKLAKLSVLIVTDCKKLTLLPRLPPCLKLLSARFCKSLQALPSDIGGLSCPEMWFDCCSQLDRALLGDMVSGFLQQAMPLHSQGSRLYPGTELPEWFHYQSEEGMAFVTVTLPAASAICEQKMKEIAFGVVTTSQPRGFMQMMTCGCYILNGSMDGSRPSSSVGALFASWSSSLLVAFDNENLSHVHLWFGNKLRPRCTTNEDQEEEEEEAWYVKYAGETVLFYFFHQGGEELKIKKCGVSLLYSSTDCSPIVLGV
ncbi:unnamed protein product [Linum trigynum]